MPNGIICELFTGFGGLDTFRIIYSSLSGKIVQYVALALALPRTKKEGCYIFGRLFLLSNVLPDIRQSYPVSGQTPDIKKD